MVFSIGGNSYDKKLKTSLLSNEVNENYIYLLQKLILFLAFYLSKETIIYDK